MKAQQAGNIRECFKALSIGKIQKATSSLLSLGTSNPSSPGIQDQLHVKHPSRKLPITPPTMEQISYERATFTVDEMCIAIKNLGRQVAPGLGGCRNEHLQALLFHHQSPVSSTAKDAVCQLHRVCHHIAMCSVPWYFFTAFTAIRLVALNKVDVSELAADAVPDVRPIGIGHSLRRLISRCIFEPYINVFCDSTKPTQYCVGEKGGITQCIFGMSSLLEANKDFVALSLDVENAYNETSRKAMLDATWNCPGLRPLFNFCYHSLLPESFIGLGAGTHLVNAKFKSMEGSQQGCVEGPLLFSAALDPVNRASHAILSQHGGGVFGIIDDTTLICPLSVALDTFILHEAKLQDIGLSINRDKCKIYLRPHLRTPANIERCTALGIQLGTLPGHDNCTTHGVKVGGVPFGDPDYIAAFLTTKASKITATVTTMCSSLSNTAPPNPSRPCNQALWVLCTRSIQHRASYFLRHIPPSATSSFAAAIDSSISKALLQSSGIDFDSCSTVVQQRLRLPHFLKGAGIRLQFFRRNLEYLGGLAQGIPPLLDRHNKTGNISIVGRLNSPSLVTLFGESSFDLDCTTPWKHLLDHHPTSSFCYSHQ